MEADCGAEPEGEDLRILLFEAARELLFNVMKHAHTSSARISMTAPKDEIILVVSDEGSGVNAARLKEERAMASGFGLFSIRERLELLGGRLLLDGAPGRGTRVTITVPFRRPDPSALESHLSPQFSADGAEAGAGKHPPKGKTRVLLADDDEIVREGLARILRAEADIEVVGMAGDGQTALELAFHHRPDVAVVNVTMPDLSGVEVTYRLTAALPGIRVIGLSVHDKEEMALTLRAAGAAAYLTKGGSPEALIAAIRGNPRVPDEDHYHGKRKQNPKPRAKAPHPAGRRSSAGAPRRGRRHRPRARSRDCAARPATCRKPFAKSSGPIRTW